MAGAVALADGLGTAETVNVTRLFRGEGFERGRRIIG
jgi:hypothetical protein